MPESVGARLKDLPPLEENANVAAAERREAFARSRRRSTAVFVVVVLLAAGALGYFGYQYQMRPDAGGTVAAASAPGDNSDAPAEPRADATQPPPATADASSLRSGNSASGESSEATKPADAPATTAANPTPPASNDVSAAPSSDADQSTNVKAVARPRSSGTRTAGKSDADSHSRPAAANEASALATQRMIERYLGVRAGVATQRSTP